MSAEADRKEKVRCECGSFGMAGIGLCSRCAELKQLREEIHDTLTTRNQCRIENKKLKGEIQTLSNKVNKFEGEAIYPFWIRVKATAYDVSKERLMEFLKVAEPLAPIVQFEYAGYDKPRRKMIRK